MVLVQVCLSGDVRMKIELLGGHLIFVGIFVRKDSELFPNIKSNMLALPAVTRVGLVNNWVMLKLR